MDTRKPQLSERLQARLDAQFAGERSALRPIFDQVIDAALAIDPTITIVPRKSYVALQKNKTFALLQATAPDRLDIGLKLPVFDDTERLQDSAGFGSASVTHKVSLRRSGDIDAELLAWLYAAYETVT